MFLITTAEVCTWKTEGKVLFLGEWCRRYDLRDVWERMDYEVLPYHWDDRLRLHSDYREIARITERCLAEVAFHLNRVHRTSHSLRYWRILVGPWLSEFIQILFDRYTSIKAALDRGIDSTVCIEYSPGRWVPRSMGDFHEWQARDDWNHHLYSQLLREQGSVRIQIIEPAEDDEVPASRRSFLKRLAGKLLSTWDRLVPSRFNGNVLLGSYFERLDAVGLQVSMGQCPYFGQSQPISVEAEPDWLQRQALLPVATTGDFHGIVSRLVPLHLPVAYLEAYEALRLSALRRYPTRPKLIYTGVRWSSDEGFKAWAAEKVESGTKLWIAQHGGNYGAALMSWTESHQKAISDRFCTWGWESEDHKAAPLPSGVLIAASRRIRPLRAGKILWVLFSAPRYSHWLYSLPIAGQFNAYLDEQILFARALTPAASSELIIRPYKIDYGWRSVERLKAAGLGQYIDNRDIPFWRALRECKLCLATYNATTFLETLSANYPTVMFWNPMHWELRPEAQPYYDALVRAGILHFTPKSAAQTINRIHDHPTEWWSSQDVQQARMEFVHRFARTDDNWRRQWVHAVKSSA